MRALWILCLSLVAFGHPNQEDEKEGAVRKRCTEFFEACKDYDNEEGPGRDKVLGFLAVYDAEKKTWIRGDSKDAKRKDWAFLAAADVLAMLGFDPDPNIKSITLSQEQEKDAATVKTGNWSFKFVMLDGQWYRWLDVKPKR